VSFVVTDTAKTIPVRYNGILPDLFKEGKGVVAQGKLEGERLRGPRGAGQARRKLHAARSAAEALDKAHQAQKMARRTLVQGR
jgi:cytochrome c-type biogenesis protein CcmE